MENYKKYSTALAFLAFALAARADINLVQNGGFEQTTCADPSAPNCLTGQFSVTGGAPAVTSVANWSTTGYNFVFASGAGDTTGSYTNQFTAAVSLWGPNNGVNNGLTAASPAGGNYIAMDSDFEVGPVTQTINDLVVGQKYTLSFYWAGAQQFTFRGATTDQITASLGGESHSTGVYSNPDQGFSGWMLQTFNYTATSTSETLSFLASGAPQLPPFALLDGVSLTATPEPGYWIPGVALLVLMAGLGIVRSKKLAKS